MLDFGDALPKEEAKQFYLTFFGEHASEETVSKMSDLDFFSQFLSFTTKQVEAAGEISFHKLEILGEIPVGDTIMHVLTRSNISVGDIEVESMEVISFRKIEGEWKALLSGK